MLDVAVNSAELESDLWDIVGFCEVVDSNAANDLAFRHFLVFPFSSIRLPGAISLVVNQVVILVVEPESAYEFLFVQFD